MSDQEAPSTRRKLSVRALLFRGSLWMIALRWAIRLTGLLSTIILARLLMPSDFGIVAMAMIVVGLLELFNQTGQKLAIIRHAEPTRQHYDTAWTMSVLVGLAVGGIIFASAPLAHLYFRDERVVPVMEVLGFRAAIAGFENVGIVELSRNLRFGRLFFYDIYQKLISFCVTVVLAFIWRNYWALVAGILSSQVSMVVLSYVMHPYRPRLSLSKIGEIYAFSGWTLFKTIGAYLNFQVDQIAVGGISGASAMGRYSVAHDISASPTQEINEPIVTALYPVMATVQKNPGELRELYLNTVAWSAIVCASTSAGVASVAHDMVHLVLGPKWQNSESLMGWLALSAGLLGVSSAAYTAFDALGKPHLGARMQWTRLGFLVAALVPVAALTTSVENLAMTRLFVTAVFLPALLLTVGAELRVSAGDYVRALWRPFCGAAIMAGAVSVLNRMLAPGNLRLLVDVLAGACVFFGSVMLLWLVSGARNNTPEADTFQITRRYMKVPLKAALG